MSEDRTEADAAYGRLTKLPIEEFERVAAEIGAGRMPDWLALLDVRDWKDFDLVLDWRVRQREGQEAMAARWARAWWTMSRNRRPFAAQEAVIACEGPSFAEAIRDPTGFVRYHLEDLGPVGRMHARLDGPEGADLLEGHFRGPNGELFRWARHGWLRGVEDPRLGPWLALEPRIRRRLAGHARLEYWFPGISAPDGGA